MDAYTQERRRLRIDTVLGQDHVLPVSLRGRDSISACFSYDIDLASTDHAIQASDILGTAATVRLDDGPNCTRPSTGSFRGSRRSDVTPTEFAVSRPRGPQPLVPHPDSRLPDLPGKERPRHRRDDPWRVWHSAPRVAAQRGP